MTNEEVSSRNQRIIDMIDAWIEEDNAHEAEFARLHAENERLLAEVERLRAELETQHAALATPEGYRGMVSDVLADEVERLHALLSQGFTAGAVWAIQGLPLYGVEEASKRPAAEWAEMVASKVTASLP